MVDFARGDLGHAHLAATLQRRQGELAVLGLDHADDRIDIGDVDRPALFQPGIERFEHPSRLIDPGRRALEQHVVAARGGRHGKTLFDEGEVLVEIAVELGGQAIVFKGEFELRCEGVVCGGWQVPAQTFSAPERGGADCAVHAGTTLG